MPRMLDNTPSSTLRPPWLRFVIGRHPKRTVIRTVVLVAACLLIFTQVLLPIKIDGDSMHPAYRDGGINFVNRMAYVWGKPKRGDVVAIKTSGLRILYLKRVVGLPGETFAITNGIVLINDKPLDEPYVKSRAAWEIPPEPLAEDEYLVIGDNRGMDPRLHAFGVVKAAKIAGRVLW